MLTAKGYMSYLSVFRRDGYGNCFIFHKRRTNFLLIVPVTQLACT